MAEQASCKIQHSKKMLYICMISVLIWGIAGHGYRFAANFISHDALNEFHGQITGNLVKISSGRILTPLYRDLIRGDITSSWLIGILSLLWLGITLFLLVQIFQIRSPFSAFLMGGILTTNLAVSATAATYIHDLDCYMFCVLCAATSVALWKFFPRRGWLWGSGLIMVILGIYQSYLFLSAVLVIMVSIMNLCQGAKARPTFFRGLKAIGMVLLGTGLYCLLLIFTSVPSQESNGYNSMDLLWQLELGKIPSLAIEAWLYSLRQIWNAYSSYPSVLVKAATGGLFLLTATALAMFFSDKQTGISEKILLFVLAAAMPLVMSAIYIISNGYIHDVMSYPVWLFYGLALLLANWLGDRWAQRKESYTLFRLPQAVAALILLFLMFSNVRFSNGMYVKKELEFQAYNSLMTRVMERVEETEGYEPGETEIVIVGLPKSGSLLNPVTPGFKDFWNVTGMTSPDVIAMGVRSRYQAYFDYVLGTPICLAEEDRWHSVVTSELAQTMPAYPKKGFTTFLDDTLLVKLGEPG